MLYFYFIRNTLLHNKTNLSIKLIGFKEDINFI